MAFKAMYGDNLVKDPKADYRDAVKIGNVRIGKEALYFPAFPAHNGNYPRIQVPEEVYRSPA